MRNSLLYILSFALLLLIWSTVRSPVQKESQESEHRRSAEQAGKAGRNEQWIPLAPPTPLPPEASRYSRVDELAPSREQVAREVSENPHVTPPSLIAFAKALAPKMEGALQNEDQGRALHEELEQCVEDQTRPAAVRGVCLKNVERLEAKYSDLAARIVR